MSDTVADTIKSTFYLYHRQSTPYSAAISSALSELYFDVRSSFVCHQLASSTSAAAAAATTQHTQLNVVSNVTPMTTCHVTLRNSTSF